MQSAAPTRPTPIAFAPILLAVALAALSGCHSDSSDDSAAFRILSPASDVVGDFSFEIAVTLSLEEYDPSSLEVRLNGQRLAVGSGPPYRATVTPGAPLRDSNAITASARRRSSGRFEAIQHRFQYAPPKARARRISDPSDLITGPLAHGRIGDWLLENSVARFIVQDAPQRDLYSVGAFGGNLIDAELRGHPGLDNFLEVQPMLNLETVINAQSVEIVNDGQDGTAAILRACGPDDLLDFVNPSSQVIDAGLPFPAAADDNDQEVSACSEYVLEPMKTWVKIDTEIFNEQPAGDLPLIVGDWMNQGGELDVFGRPNPGLGAALTAELGAMSFIGFADAAGVDYSFTTTPDVGKSNYVVISGVSVILHHASPLALLLGTTPFSVPLGGSRHSVRYFGVGDGSGSNAVDMENTVKSRPTGRSSGQVRVGGVPAVGAHVSLGTVDGGGAIAQLVTTFVTDADGRYDGSVPIANPVVPYGLAAARRGTPYEGGGTSPTVKQVTFAAVGEVHAVDFDLPATGSLSVSVQDASGPLPARITVVGFDPSPNPIRPGSTLPGFGSSDLGLFDDPGDRHPFGVVAVAYADATGSVDFEIEPGSYEVYVSRGNEYSLFSAPVTVAAGPATPVDARIARVLDTDGFVSSDFHVHGIDSADSRVSHRRRVLGYAAEGIDNLVMTDHHAHTDLRPTIAALGLGPWLATTVGEEITTFDYGHFNAYPLAIDPTRTSRGSTDWAKAAPAGQDFPAPRAGAPAYNATPAEIFQLATNPALPGSTALPDTTIQVNHIGSHFVPLKIDTGVFPIADGLDAAARLDRRLDPAAGNLFHPFPALELWNGSGRRHQAEFLVERIGIWMNLLNHGLHATMISDTDSHAFENLESAGAVTWTAAGAATDAPATLDGSEVARRVVAGKAVGGQGIFVTTRLLEQAGSGVADLTSTGDTHMSAAGGNVDLEITVQAPLWAEYDRIEIYANAATTPVDPNRPYLYGATPTRVLNAGDGDFTIDTLVVDASIPGASRRETRVLVPFPGLGGDTWFVVVARGTDGVSRPMFPVFAKDLAVAGNTLLADLVDGNLGESGVMALGVTNPLYYDAP